MNKYNVITPDGESFVLAEVPGDKSYHGYAYNNVYTKGDNYEFHSLPYNELPPVDTGISTKTHIVVPMPELELRRFIEKLFNTFDSRKIPTNRNYVLFKERDNSKKEENIS